MKTTKDQVMLEIKNGLVSKIESLNNNPKNKILPFLAANDIFYMIRYKTPNIVEYRCERFNLKGILNIAI